MYKIESKELFKKAIETNFEMAFRSFLLVAHYSGSEFPAVKW
jgi:hypothetical protein